MKPATKPEQLNRYVTVAYVKPFQNFSKCKYIGTAPRVRKEVQE
jgi:hypothetical protein